MGVAGRHVLEDPAGNLIPLLEEALIADRIDQALFRLTDTKNAGT